jgi:hypothetical protein
MPCTTGDIRIRLSKDQRELIKQKAVAAGYVTISDFIRDRIFREDKNSESMIREIYEALCITKAYNVNKEGDLKANKRLKRTRLRPWKHRI